MGDFPDFRSSLRDTQAISNHVHVNTCCCVTESQRQEMSNARLASGRLGGHVLGNFVPREKAPRWAVSLVHAGRRRE